MIYHIIVKDQSNKLITFTKVDRKMAALSMKQVYKAAYPNHTISIKPF